MDEDRRRHPRYEVENIQGTLAGRERHDLRVLVLSRGGVLGTTSLEPPLGQVLDLEIPLGGRTFRAPAKVVFVGDDRAEVPRHRRFRVGLALNGLTAEDGEILDTFIRELIG
jgi:hypothetical protein